MMDWWQQLAPRERLILFVGGFLAVAIIGWRFIWIPLQSGSETLNASVAELTDLLVDVQRAAGLQANAGSAGASASANMLTLVQQTASPIGLASSIENQRLEGSNAMYVTFRNAPFDVLNSWLTLLELEHGVSVMQVSSISSAGTPGLVNGQVLIGRM